MDWQKQSWNRTVSLEILARDIFILICVKAEKQTVGRGRGRSAFYLSFTIKAEKNPRRWALAWENPRFTF